VDFKLPLPRESEKRIATIGDIAAPHGYDYQPLDFGAVDPIPRNAGTSNSQASRAAWTARS